MKGMVSLARIFPILTRPLTATNWLNPFQNFQTLVWPFLTHTAKTFIGSTEGWKAVTSFTNDRKSVTVFTWTVNIHRIWKAAYSITWSWILNIGDQACTSALTLIQEARILHQISHLHTFLIANTSKRNTVRIHRKIFSLSVKEIFGYSSFPHGKFHETCLFFVFFNITVLRTV